MDSKFDRRNRPQKEREIYTPGSGPLRRTDNAEGKSFTNRKYNHYRNEKCDYNAEVNSFEHQESKSDQLNDEHYDRDRKKNRKPDASIYIPKQRYREDSSHLNIDSSEHSSGYSSGFGSSNKLADPRQMIKERHISEGNNYRHDDSQARKTFIESKQFTRGSRTDLSHNWKDSSVKENTDLRFERNSQNSASGSNERNIPHQTEYKNTTFYNRFGNERNSDRGASEKNRGGKNLMRRNSSNSLVLPDAFYSWPPRLRRQHLESKGIKGEELDKYLENRNDFGGNNSRDRFSHAPLPPKNRSSRFKSSKKDPPKERVEFNVPRTTEKRIDDVRPTQESNHEPEKNHESETNTGGSVEDLSDDVSKNCTITGSTYSSCIIDTKSILDDSFNWAEEVEREQLIAERNNSEAEDRSRIDEICVNEDRKEKKKRRRREFRRKRGFSYERKNPQRSRNASETENQNRRKDDDRYRSNDNNARHVESSNNDGYLSWRRNKNPSPSRSRLGIMTRNYRNDGSKFEGTRNFSSDQERINNKIKINNKMNELPNLVKDPAGDPVAGIIKIPQPPATNQTELKCSAPVFPEPHISPFPNKPIKQLYNPTNPKQPIIVSNQSARAAVGPPPLPIGQHFVPPAAAVTEHATPIYLPSYLDPSVTAIVAPTFLNDQYLMPKPAWYDAYSDSFRSTHNAHLLLDISRADTELQTLLQPGTVVRAWDRITDLRTFLQDALRTLLTSDLKFCEAENVEQHMWKILFYNVIELLRKCIIEDVTNMQKYKNLLFLVIDKGVEYFRSLIVLLERTYKIRIEDFLNVETASTKQLGLSGLALISAQKIYLSLGDLARYRETTEESSTYGNSRHWYIKANQLNPRNGRPYNQLAILAVYARKKFDAVYYYMRSLMASNPFFTARESLLALFDENRKKYEQIEKNRRELKEQKKQEKAKEKESVINGSMLRKEVWIRPDDGQRIQRTTSTSQECQDDSDDDDLHNLSAAEVNKRFLLSFLHVHGKLFSKVGMETLQEAAIEMLKEFKVLLNFTPLPINANRLIQLLALNMFAIDNGQLKDPQLESGYHSAVQESALVISLQMFNLIINRCVQLLREQLQQMKKHPDRVDWNYPLIVSADVQILLPAIKLWCDWLFCHSTVWNPPPSCQDYRISGCGDCWNRLAVLINLLEELDYQEVLRKNGQQEPILIMEPTNGASLLRITLDEDVALRGFTPLMCNAQQPVFTHKNVELELAQICLRIHRILFFGTIFLCGIDPPVLKLHKTETGLSEYISVVEEVVTPKEQSDSENVYEQWSDNEEANENVDDDAERNAKMAQMSDEEKSLVNRKKELERIHLKREKYMRDKKETIQKDIAAFSVEMEIKPHYLVPDTNCFIDYLPELEKIVKAVSSTQRPLYSLMVPLIVLGELEGIARGAHKDDRVTEKARFALNFLQNGYSYSNIKCVTTRGSVLPSTRFTSEEDYSKVEKNDDKILTTCLNLCKHNDSNDNTSDQPKRIYREVVLMTEDRNLRVKALSSNMPVQTVADFIKWAGLQ